MRVGKSNHNTYNKSVLENQGLKLGSKDETLVLLREEKNKCLKLQVK